MQDEEDDGRMRRSKGKGGKGVSGPWTDGTTTPRPPTARPQQANGRATTQHPREYVTHVPRLCPRLARASCRLCSTPAPVKTAAGGQGGGKPSVNVGVTGQAQGEGGIFPSKR